MAEKLKSKKTTTENIRKKYGACEHDQVAYVELEKAIKQQTKSIKLRDRVIDRLSEEIDRKGRTIDEWTKSRGRWIDVVNKGVVEKEAKHKTEVAVLEKYIADLEEANKELKKVNSDCIKINRNIIKDHHEITRAYNGLAEMGKFVEDKVIAKHNKQLPESNPEDFTDFKQKHTLLENGKVLHQWSMKKKKKVEEK